MVTIEQDQRRNTSLILEPNRSLSADMSRVFWVGVLTPALFVCALFLLMGAWLVIPFIVAESALLLSLMYWVRARDQAREELWISADAVAVRKQLGPRLRIWRFERAHLSLLLGVDDRLTPCHITLCGDGGLVDIGEFLSHDELQQLLVQLRRQGLPARCNLQWCLLAG